MFSAAVEKDVPVTGVLLQENAKLLYEQLFSDATTPFSASTGFSSRFVTLSLISETVHTVVHCIAV